MSTNTHLTATADVTFISGATKRLYESCDLFQTPSKDTRKIVESKDCFKAYLDYVKEWEEKYASGDKNSFPVTEQEKTKIEQFINSHPEHDGWKIEWEAW